LTKNYTSNIAIQMHSVGKNILIL